MSAGVSHNPVPGWCRELEAGFRAGRPGRAEDYLARAPGLDPEDAVELVYTEFVCREEFGPPPDPAEFLARFPALRTQLEEQFLVHRTLAPDRAPPAPREQSVGPYRLVREVGRGGRGAVFLATDSRDGRAVALKVLLSGEYATPADLDLFRREADALARLDHPNLVRIVEAGEDGGRPYLAMEFADGPPLSACAARYRDPRAAAALVEALARALHHAHGRGVVHRDLKPSNVLLTAGGMPKLGDFGLARVLDARSARTRTGDVVGTLGYMAPEQAAGGAHRAGPGADVYALGAVLYDLLAGRPPFGHEPTARALFELFQEPPASVRAARPEVPRDLETVCLRCLEKHPARRYPTALALADDLRRFLDGRPVTARAPGAAVRFARWARRRPAAAAALGVLAAAAVALVAGGLYYTARLSAANDDLQRSLGTAEELRDVVSGQKEAAERQLDDARRALYAMQLSQLPALWSREPIRARDLLGDARLCPPDLREFTWHYFRNLCRLDEREFPAHKGETGAVAFLSEDRLLTGGADGRVRCWDPLAPADRRAVFNLAAHGKGVSTIAVLGPDRFATAGPDGTVKVWAVGQPKPERTVAVGGGANRLAADRAMGRLAGACADGVVRVWDAADGRELAALTGHDGVATAVAFAPNGGTLYTGGTDRTVRAWDLVEGRAVVWPGHAGAVLGLAVSPDGRAVASTGGSGDVRLWSAADGTARELRGHLLPVHAAAFSPDGARVVTGGEDSYLKVWDPADGAELANVMRYAVRSAAFSPDGRVALGTRDGKVLVYRLPDPAPAVRFPHPAYVAAVVALPGGGVALADAAGEVRVSDGAAFAVPPLSPGVPGRPLAVGTGGPPPLAVSPDGATLAAGGGDGTVVLWDVAARTERRRVAAHAGNVAAVAFLPDGRLVTGGEDKLVRVWGADGTAVELKGCGGPVLAVAVSPDGRRVAAGGEDATVRVWDLADPAAPPAEVGRHDNRLWVLCLAFDPTGKRVASGGRDRTVRVWDLDGGPPLVLRGYTNWVHGVAFSPDGKTLATASGHHGLDTPGEVKLCDPVAGYVRAILTDVRAPVAFAAGGRRLYAGTRGGVAELIGE